MLMVSGPVAVGAGVARPAAGNCGIGAGTAQTSEMSAERTVARTICNCIILLNVSSLWMVDYALCEEGKSCEKVAENLTGSDARPPPPPGFLNMIATAIRTRGTWPKVPVAKACGLGTFDSDSCRVALKIRSRRQTLQKIR